MNRSWQYLLTVASLLVISVFSISQTQNRIQLPTVSSRSQVAQVGGGGATYYVSPAGSDSNSGAIDAPWQTFDRAFDSSQTSYLQGGDTLYLREGIHRSTKQNLTTDNQISGSSEKPTHISGYPGEHALLYLSTRVDTGWQEYSGGTGAKIWYVNWKSIGRDVPQIVDIDGNPPTVLQEVNSAKNANPINDNQITSFRTNQDDMIAGDFYYESDTGSPNYGNLYVALPNGSEPNGQPIEVGLSQNLFHWQHYVTISNFSIRYSNYGLTVDGNDNIIDSIDSSYSGYTGLMGLCSNCVVRNSVISHNGESGATLSGPHTLYENNTFEANNYRLYSSNWACGGMKIILDNDGMIVRGNTYKDNIACPGLWFDNVPSGTGGLTIENNKFINNGLMIEISSGSASSPIMVRNNIFESNGIISNGIYVSASDYVYIYNNTFNKGGVMLHGLGGTRYSVSNNRIISNIFYNQWLPIYIVYNPPAPYKSDNNISDYNLLFGQSMLFGNAGINANHPDQPDWDNGISYTVWKSRGFDAHSIVGDPLFTNASGGDYTLRAGSPALGAGLQNSYVTTDIRGIARNGVDDIGAHQVSVATPPATDTTAPVVTAFTIPATATSLTIPITSFTATDPSTSVQQTSGVNGYMVTETNYNSAVSATASGWSSTAPTSYTFSTAGTKTLYAYAKDAAGNVSASRSASVTITLAQQNNPPILSAIGNKSVNENSNLSFTVSASDPDKDPLTYSAGGLPAGAIFDASIGTFSWTPVLAQSGSYTITFGVRDSMGATDSEVVTVTVNHNPMVTPTSIVISAVSAGTPLQTSATITWTTDKVSSSQINYGLTSSYGSSTPLSSIWTKSHSQTLSNLLPKTTYHYRVSSNDPLNELGTSPDHTFSTAPDLVVGTTTPDVTSPMVTVFIIPATTASLTVSITTLTATDAVGVVGYMISESSTKPSATASVGWSGTKPTSYTFGSAGSKTLYAWAKDAEGNVSESLSDTVVITLPNRPPIAEAGLNISITLPASANLSASASSDPDGGTLTYSWSKVSGPGTVTFSSVSSLTPTVTFSDAGTYVIRLTASDGVLSSTDQITVIANLVPVTTYTLTSSAGSHGSITPLGVTTVNPGNNWVFVIAPATGYQVANVVVDGSVVSLSNSRYTFTNITANHAISVNFTQVVAPPPPYVPTPIVVYTPVTTVPPTLSPPSPLPTSQSLTHNAAPDVIPSPTTVYTSHTTTVNESSNTVTSTSSSPSTTDPIYELSLLTATSTDMTFTPPPSMPEFLVSFAKENIDSAISAIQYVIDRVVSGLKNTVALPNSQ